jgi:hypothetical protein
MRYLLLICSIAFAVYGMLPFRKATNVDTSIPNQLIVEQQECGCPCPNAVILKGQLNIPPEIALKYQPIHTTQINLDIEDFNQAYNLNLGMPNLFVKGKVTGIDTILCEPANCELAARFKVESWACTGYVARAWTFPMWAGIFFMANLILFAPALAITEIVRQVRNLQFRS